ncbi:MAG TPA: YigZ family protein [Thermoanaerobaculia bacterium]|nr:YigZ family protein [Thermoanaerobaculia bacterium]
MPSYSIPAAGAEAEFRDRGSVFLAVISPVASEEEARSALADVERRFPDATHWCWAWRLGAEGRERASDAGEPAGTAGKPMLQVLRGAEISDVLAVVVRWFGGTKLGKGGLARAYAAAVRAALDGLPRTVRSAMRQLSLNVPYDKIGAVKRLIQPPVVVLLGERYGESVRLDLAVVEENEAALRAALADLRLEPGTVP